MNTKSSLIPKFLGRENIRKVNKAIREAQQIRTSENFAPRCSYQLSRAAFGFLALWNKVAQECVLSIRSMEFTCKIMIVLSQVYHLRNQNVWSLYEMSIRASVLATRRLVCLLNNFDFVLDQLHWLDRQLQLQFFNIHRHHLKKVINCQLSLCSSQLTLRDL